jgi:hypothetical protein
MALEGTRRGRLRVARLELRHAAVRKDAEERLHRDLAALERALVERHLHHAPGVR